MSDRNGNSNCLEGYECPKCGEHDELNITVTTVVEMRDSGTGDHQDTEWDENSHVDCPSCGHGGPASEFKFDEEEEEEEEEDEENDAQGDDPETTE